MKITVLGSGTSTGVPIIGCRCGVCLSDNPKNKRLRSSCLVECEGKSILIDTSPDLRQQALTHHIPRIDAVLFTHNHADHVHGIDDLRVFNAWQNQEIPIFGDHAMMEHLIDKFGYIFKPSLGYTGFVPKLVPHVVSGQFDCVGVPVTMLPCEHGPRAQTMNYRIGNMAWLTDTSGIPEATGELMQGLDVLFVDGLRIEPHNTHFNLEQALKAARQIGAKQTYLIHLAHDYDHDEFEKTLPEGVKLAFDGLTVTLPSNHHQA